ncbi:hypothetical protein D3C72_2298610 [compost metagenome]
MALLYPIRQVDSSPYQGEVRRGYPPKIVSHPAHPPYPNSASSRFPASMNALGLIALSALRTSKCRCGPVERPVEPTLAIGVPVLTAWPSSLRKPDRCA